jgi:hypothetical protein
MKKRDGKNWMIKKLGDKKLDDKNWLISLLVVLIGAKPGPSFSYPEPEPPSHSPACPSSPGSNLYLSCLSQLSK